jgi:hypothetical protein
MNQSLVGEKFDSLSFEKAIEAEDQSRGETGPGPISGFGFFGWRRGAGQPSTAAIAQIEAGAPLAMASLLNPATPGKRSTSESIY